MTKVLIAEDDPFLVKVYQLKLEKIGYDVKILTDGTLVKETAISFQPNVIVLDILMPLKDGYSALTDLKSDPITSSIPVIILSALQMDQDIKKGLGLGANIYHPKTNVSFDEVVNTITKLTSQST